MPRVDGQDSNLPVCHPSAFPASPRIAQRGPAVPCVDASDSNRGVCRPSAVPCRTRPYQAPPILARPSIAVPSPTLRERRGLEPRWLPVARLLLARPRPAKHRPASPRLTLRGRPRLEPGCVPLALPCPCHAPACRTRARLAAPSTATPHVGAEVLNLGDCQPPEPSMPNLAVPGIAPLRPARPCPVALRGPWGVEPHRRPSAHPLALPCQALPDPT